MSLIVAHNLSAINANRQSNLIERKRTKVMEQLSSGYRINRAAFPMSRPQTAHLKRFTLSSSESVRFLSKHQMAQTHHLTALCLISK